jgi:parvulin-like peptidyl-prolyl isomerase
MKTAGRCIAAALISSILGCGRATEPPPFRPAMAAGGSPTIPTDPGSPVDQPGRLSNGQIDTATGRPARTASEQTGHPSETVQQNVKASWLPDDLHLSATAPVARPTTGLAFREYLTVGGVVAEVNSVPIYADKVLSTLQPVLAAKAREANEKQFRQIALSEIRDQIRAMVNLELEYAAAARNLDTKDKELANNLTADWRRRQIAEAEGSLELARKRVSERGQSFDDLVNDKYREFMSRIYYEKKVIPRIQVTAQDMRQYYDRNLDAQFTEHAKARFRLIKISVKQVGDRDLALKKIQDIRERIVAGQDIAAIAGTTNHDPALLKSAGEFQAEKGAFAVQKVEDAIWATPPGELTGIIDAGDAFYLAKVEEKTKGRVVPFDEEGVQARIREKLRSEQFRALRDQVQQTLLKDAIVRSDADMAQVALEMAMQNYPRWAAR